MVTVLNFTCPSNSTNPFYIRWWSVRFSAMHEICVFICSSFFQAGNYQAAINAYTHAIRLDCKMHAYTFLTALSFNNVHWHIFWLESLFPNRLKLDALTSRMYYICLFRHLFVYLLAVSYHKLHLSTDYLSLVLSLRWTYFTLWTRFFSAFSYKQSSAWHHRPPVNRHNNYECFNDENCLFSEWGEVWLWSIVANIQHLLTRASPVSYKDSKIRTKNEIRRFSLL